MDKQEYAEDKDKILEEIDRSLSKTKGSSIDIHKNIREETLAYKNISGFFLRKIQGDRRGRLFIYLANDKLLNTMGFKKGDALKVYIIGNRIIMEKYHKDE